MQPHTALALSEIEAARERLRPHITRTPLLRLQSDDAPAEIYLKLENLQPTGSFKLRGAASAIEAATPEELKDGVYTSSSGNMAQAVAWMARRKGLSCVAVVPDNAPEGKLAAIRRLGAEVHAIPYAAWWQVMLEHRYAPLAGRFFVHPSSNRAVMAGYGTMAQEILEDLPDVQAIVVPYGSGGSVAGIGCAIRALAPRVKVFAAEVSTGAPLAGSLAAGEPVEVPFTPSFVDGIGSRCLLREMWPLVRSVVDGALVVSLDEIAAAIRLLAERGRIVAEGAGAAQAAAALKGLAGGGQVACIVSGGNLSLPVLASVLAGQTPQPG